MNSKRTAKAAVIVEIGSDWLKVVQAHPSRGGVEIDKIHAEKFESMGSGLMRAIAGAFERQKFDAMPVILCLPRQFVTLRVTELPSTSPDEIASMAELQVGKQTPYSKDEIVYDYTACDGSRPGYSRVMMAIVQNSVVRERFHALEEAGVRVGQVSVSTEGFLQWYLESVVESGDEGRAVALVDVDSAATDVMVVDTGSVAFSRSILVGAGEAGDDSAGWSQRLAREIKRSIEACAAETAGLNVRKLIVTGAAGRIRDLAEAVGQETGLPVEAADSLRYAKKLPKSFSAADPELRGVSLTSVIGMAFAAGSLDFNLIPDSVRLRRDLVSKARGLAALGMLTMATMVAFSIYGTSKLYLKASELDRLQSRVKSVAVRVKDVSDKQSVIREVQARKDNQLSSVNVLYEVHRIASPSIALDTFDMDLDKGQVRLAGTGATRSDVSSFQKGLEQSSLVKGKVSTDGTVARDRESGRFTFKLIVDLEKAP